MLLECVCVHACACCSGTGDSAAQFLSKASHKRHADIVLLIYVCLDISTKNDQNLNLDPLLSDQGKLTLCLSQHFFLNGRHFKGIKCVGLTELSSAGLKLIGLISEVLISYGTQLVENSSEF